MSIHSVTETQTERQAADLPDDWDSLVSIGQSAREGMDGWRWLLGDIAGTVETRYGTDALGSYAGEVNIIPRTLRSYRTVASFYPSGTRGHFPNLTWSHYRDAARLGELESALDLLERASADNWTWRDLTDALNVALGRPAVRRALLETEVVATDDGLRVNDALLVPGARYAVKVYSHAE